MSDDRHPVILVHGWNSHPGVWKSLISRLETAEIPYYRFDHTHLKHETMPVIAGSLGDYFHEIQPDIGWNQPVDIVCHSLGACIVRHLLEVMDKADRSLPVRQVIALGPTNNGSTLAELFNDPERSQEIITQLAGIFVPHGFDPTADPIVQNVRPDSPFMQTLRTAGLRPDITYRTIVTENPSNNPEFFPWFEGRTWERSRDGTYRTTLNGDGIVANQESALPGIPLDILSASPARTPPPDQYNHIYLPKNPRVIDRIVHYLTSGAEYPKDCHHFGE